MAYMKRHLKEIHKEEESSSCETKGQKQHVCNDCGKVFEFASRLRKYEDSHVKLDTVEVICGEPCSMKPFTNAECLKAHIQSCHQHVTCEVCSQKHLKKIIKRHLCVHEAGVSSSDTKCSFKGCSHTFTTKSNLNQYIKAAHLVVRPFPCRIYGCDQKFPYRHVRDKHEKSGIHVYVQGDFVESDELFRSKPRGGPKRACPTVETLLWKRVTPHNQTDSVSNQGTEYIAWLLSGQMSKRVIYSLYWNLSNLSSWMCTISCTLNRLVISQVTYQLLELDSDTADAPVQLYKAVS